MAEIVFNQVIIIYMVLAHILWQFLLASRSGRIFRRSFKFTFLCVWHESVCQLSQKDTHVMFIFLR